MFQHVQKCLRIVTIHIILNLNKFRHVLTIIQKNLENLEDLENLKNLDNWVLWTFWELTCSSRSILSSDLGLNFWVLLWLGTARALKHQDRIEKERYHVCYLGDVFWSFGDKTPTWIYKRNWFFSKSTMAAF